MAHQYAKHYTLEEARALLPQVREWLKELQPIHAQLMKFDELVATLLAGGKDAGGELVNNWVKMICAMRKVLRKFASREIEIKDVERGLLDFPTLRAGREVFLCWEQDEEDIEFWHELEAGYGGRERL